MDDKLQNYMARWALAEPEPLAETQTGVLYKVEISGGAAVLKMFKTAGQEDESGSPAALRAFNGKGAVRVLNYDTEALLLEFADGQNLVPFVRQGHDDKATAIIAETVTKLHAAVAEDEIRVQLTPLKTWFRSLFEKAALPGSNSLYVRGAKMAEQLLRKPEREVVLHGDVHHENIIHHSTRGWLAIDPKGLYGDRAYDVANTLYNPMDRAFTHDKGRLLRQSGILAQKMKIDQSRILSYAFAYGCLSAAWSEEDGCDPANTLELAAMAESVCRP